MFLHHCIKPRVFLFLLIHKPSHPTLLAPRMQQHQLLKLYIICMSAKNHINFIFYNYSALKQGDTII